MSNGELLTTVAPTASRDETVKGALANLTSLIPADAITVYLSFYNFFPDSRINLWALMLVGLIVLLVVRLVAKSSLLYTSLSILAYIIWVYSIGNGPFQTLALMQTINPIWGTILVVAYGAITTVLASTGKIKA